MNLRSLLPAFILISGCGSVDPPLEPVGGTDPSVSGPSIVGKDVGLSINLPGTFREGILQIAILENTDDFVAGIYGEPEGATKFVYGTGGTVGYILDFGDPFEAAARHDLAAERTVGDLGLPGGLGHQTLRDYNARFFYDGQFATLFFKMREQTVTIRVDSGDQEPSVGLRWAADLATQVFELNDLNGTFPITQLDLLRPTPPSPDGFTVPAMRADAKLLAVDPLPFRKLNPRAHDHIRLRLSLDLFAADTLVISLRPYLLRAGDNWSYVRDQAEDAVLRHTIKGRGKSELEVLIPVPQGATEDTELRIDSVFETGMRFAGLAPFLRYRIGQSSP